MGSEPQRAAKRTVGACRTERDSGLGSQAENGKESGARGLCLSSAKQVGNSCGLAGSSHRQHGRQRRAAATGGTAGDGRQQQRTGATSRPHQPADALAPSLHSSRGASVCGRCSAQREGRLAVLFGRLAARSQHAGLTSMIARMGTMLQARRTKAGRGPG